MSRLYQVIWTRSAERDLEAVTDFISKGSPQAALKIFRSIRLKATLLRRFPQRGRMIPELSHIPGLPFRELILKPWRLFYRLKDSRVEVLAFFDGRRDLSEVIFERLSRAG